MQQYTPSLPPSAPSSARHWGSLEDGRPLTRCAKSRWRRILSFTWQRGRRPATVLCVVVLLVWCNLWHQTRLLESAFNGLELERLRQQAVCISSLETGKPEMKIVAFGGDPPLRMVDPAIVGVHGDQVPAMESSSLCPEEAEVNRHTRVDVEFSEPGGLSRIRRRVSGDQAACIQYAVDLHNGQLACMRNIPTRPSHTEL